jgi:MFS family permease
VASDRTFATSAWKAALARLITLQSLVSTSAVILATVNGLAGLAIAPDPKLATLPVTAYVLGGAVSTFGASQLMARIGRRAGFMVGIGFGATGAVVCAFAAQTRAFALLCAGSLIIGIYAAFGQYARFAAAEIVPERFKSRAISWVLAGGVVGAFVGPESAKWTKDLTAVPFVGAYLSLAALTLLAFAATFGLPHGRPAVEPVAAREGGLRALARLDVVVAMASAVTGYAVMLFVMTATPLAMLHHRHHFDDTALVIEWHVLGMFAPSFVTGSIIRRVGVLKVIAMGALMMVACVAINVAGVTVAHFWTALVLLGVGWNFMFVGGTTLLTSACREEEKALGQGVNEVLVYSANAVASLTAGLLLHRVGWQTMNRVALPFLLVVVGLCLWLGWRQSRPALAV